MPELSRLVLEIDSKGVVTANGNLDLFKQKAKEAGAQADKVKKSTKDTSDGMGGLSQQLGIAAIAWGSIIAAQANFIKSSVEASGKMEMLKTNLQVVTGSATDADTIFRKLNKFANETPFSVEGITDTATQLMQVGVSAKDLMSQLQMLGDVSGGSQEKLNRIMMNYTQILSVGHASTMDVRQFAQANLPIYQELEKVTGKTGDALQDMITNGKITGEVITKAFQDMTAEGGKFYNGMNLLSDTYQGKLSTAKDSVNNLAAAFGNLWLLPAAKALLGGTSSVSGGMANWLTSITDGKVAYDTFNNNYANSSFQQREYVANKQLEYWGNRKSMLQRAGGDFKSDPEWQEAKEQYNAWDDYLNKITKDEAALEKSQREAAQATLEAAKNGSAVAEASLKWQEVLKKAFSLDALPKTGAQAFSEYQNNIEASLNGAIAYAQMTGGKISDVYLDYAKQVGDAAEMLLKSGLWTPDEETIKRVMALRNLYGAIGGEKSTAEPDLSNPGAITGTKFASGQQGESEYDKQIKKLDEQAAAFGRSREEQRRYELSLQGITDKTEQDTIIQKESILALLGAWKELGTQLEQFGATAVFDSLDDIGAALYNGANGAEAFGKALLKSILHNVPAMLFQAGFQMMLIPGGAGIIPGLALMAASGIAQVGVGYLDAMSGSSSEQSEADKLKTISDQLEDLISQAKNDAEYYQNMLRTKTAQVANNAVSNTKVNDAIIAPGGKIITTAPDDYLYAAKDPGKFGGAGGSVVNISVLNTVGESVSATATSKQNSDGTTQIIVMVKKLIASDIASGGMDNALAAREARLQGRRISS